MPDAALRDLARKRLDAKIKPDEWSALALAAPEGPAELETPPEGSGEGPGKAVGGVVAGEPQAPPAGKTQQPRIAFLKCVIVEGLRGRGPQATLELPPRPVSGWPSAARAPGSPASPRASNCYSLLERTAGRFGAPAGAALPPKVAIAVDLALEKERGS